MDRKQKIMEKWYDVQDQEGIWRVGYIINQDKSGSKMIALDGFHPSHNTFYCTHSGKIAPVRTHTNGLTVPSKKTLRTPFKLSIIQSMQGRINLYLLQSKLLELSPQTIKVYLRTQFLIQIDRIFTTPFAMIKQLKMADLHINKLFINLINFYFRVIEVSKKFTAILNTNPNAKQLYKSLYQLTIIVSMVTGLHPRSKNFYQNELNLTIKSQGFLDYLIKSQGVLPFKLLLKNLSCIQVPNQQNLLINLCQRNKNQLIQGKLQSDTLLVIQEIIAHLKLYIQKNQMLKEVLRKDIGLISRIQTFYVKLKPNKHCSLRKIIQKQKQQLIPNNSMTRSIENIQDDQKVNKLQERIKKMEILLINQQKNGNISLDSFKKNKPNSVPMENLGEQMFLGSLEWALEMGDLITAKKLVKWRRTLLQIGRITGWQVALNIGCKTYKKCQINNQDIIEANYEHIMKQSVNSIQLQQ